MSVRELYQREARNELADLTAQIDLLRRRSATAGMSPASAIDERLVSLETQTKLVDGRLQALENSQEDAWEGIQTELRRSIEELTEEVAAEALTVQQMVGHRKPLVEGLRIAYLRRANAQIDDLALEIDTFIASVSRPSMRDYLHLQKRMQNLQQLRQRCQGRLQELAGSTQTTWEELTSEIESLVCSLRRALAEAECELNDTVIRQQARKENSSWQKEKPIERRPTLN